MRFSYLTVMMWIATAPAAAQTFSYDFDGTLLDHFTREVNDGQFFEQPAVPIDNELEFHNFGNNPAVTDNSEVYGYDDILPYDESWFVCIDLGLPLSYDPIAAQLNDAFAAVGLAIGFLPNGFNGSGVQAFVSSLDLDSFDGSTDRTILTDYSFEDDEVLEIATDASGLASVKVTFTFDADEKKLRALTDLSIVPVLEIDIDEGDNLDWGMTDDDFFEVFLFGESGGADGLPITANEPLTLDNFRVGLLVPEPQAAILAALGMLSAIRLRKSRLAISIT